MKEKIKKFFRELFCSHIYETIDIKNLGVIRKTRILGGVAIDSNRYDRNAETEKCLKCRKERVREVHRRKTDNNN